jgi:hypothetical protein
MLDVRLAAFRGRPVPKILWIEHIRTNRDTLREADARHCQPSGAWRIGVHHDLPPFGPDASFEERGPFDGSSVPANAPYVLGIDLNRSESRWGAADPSCIATQTIAHAMRQEAAALRDFSPAYVRIGSLASHRYAHDARAMSAFTPIASKHWQRSETTRCANSGCEQSQQKKLLDHLVGGDKQPSWHGQAERTLGDWSSLLRPLKWANSLLIFLLTGNLVRRQVRFAITDSRPRPERWQAQDVVGCL